MFLVAEHRAPNHALQCCWIDRYKVSCLGSKCRVTTSVKLLGNIIIVPSLQHEHSRYSYSCQMEFSETS